MKLSDIMDKALEIKDLTYEQKIQILELLKIAQCSGFNEGYDKARDLYLS